jgi:hypothetical protein
MKQTFDTDTYLFGILSKKSEITTALTGGVYKGDDGRPDNSEKEDIVVNTINLSQEYAPQVGTSNVNIHVPDVSVSIGGKQQKKANTARLKELSELVLDTLRNAVIPGVSCMIENQTVIQESQISQHFVNIRINWNIH